MMDAPACMLANDFYLDHYLVDDSIQHYHCDNELAVMCECAGLCTIDLERPYKKHRSRTVYAKLNADLCT